MAGNSRKRKTKNKSGGRLDFGSVSLSVSYLNRYHLLSTAADDRRSPLVLHFTGVILCGKPCAGDLFFYSGIAPCCAPQTRQEERRVRVYVFTGFSTSAIAYLFITIFIYFNYPESWRKNRMFIATLILWHIIGLASVVMVFTVFKHITHEGMKYELARIGTCYYIVTTMQAILFTL